MASLNKTIAGIGAAASLLTTPALAGNMGGGWSDTTPSQSPPTYDVSSGSGSDSSANNKTVVNSNPSSYSGSGAEAAGGNAYTGPSSSTSSAYSGPSTSSAYSGPSSASTGPVSASNGGQSQNLSNSYSSKYTTWNTPPVYANSGQPGNMAPVYTGGGPEGGCTSTTQSTESGRGGGFSTPFGGFSVSGKGKGNFAQWNDSDCRREVIQGENYRAKKAAEAEAGAAIAVSGNERDRYAVGASEIDGYDEAYRNYPGPLPVERVPVPVPYPVYYRDRAPYHAARRPASASSCRCDCTPCPGSR